MASQVPPAAVREEVKPEKPQISIEEQERRQGKYFKLSGQVFSDIINCLLIF